MELNFCYLRKILFFYNFKVVGMSFWYWFGLINGVNYGFLIINIDVCIWNLYRVIVVVRDFMDRILFVY